MSSVVDYSPSRRNYDIFEDSVKMGKLLSSPTNERANNMLLIAGIVSLVAALVILAGSHFSPTIIAPQIAAASWLPLNCDGSRAPTLVLMGNFLIGVYLGVMGNMLADAATANKENGAFIKEFKGKLESLKDGQSLTVISPYDQSRRTVAKSGDAHFTCETTVCL